MTFVASVAVATDGARRWLAGRVGLTPWRVDRLAQFLCFAATAYLQNILAMTVASSLFLSHVGAESLPLCFILLGLVAAIGFTILGQWVDRFSRVRLFQYVLAGAIVWMLGLRLLLGFDWLPLYFILSISAFFLFDLHANLLFPNLLTDYFTTLEYKRNTPFLGLAQAFGILLAGGLTPLLLTWLSTPDLLFILVGLYGLSIAQLAYLEAMQRRLEAPPPKTRFSSWQYLQTLPTLIKGSPLIFFLAASSFIFILVYVMSEFLWFSLYSQRFQGDELTGFLGLARILTSSTQLVTLYCFTRPLLQGLGVGRMNVVYPLTTLASLASFALQPGLTTALVVNVNGDAWDKGINKPVHQLNYNALPPEISGRVRALTDGVFYALGLSLAGAILWFSHEALSLSQVTALAMGLTVLMLVLRWPMGRYYAQGLETLIRANILNLSEISRFQAPIPSESQVLIRDLLQEEADYSRLMGLELALGVSRPSQFWPELEALLTDASPPVRRALVKLCGQGDGDVVSQCETWLTAGDDLQQGFALEVLLVRQFPLTEEQLLPLLTAPEALTRLLAALALELVGGLDLRVEAQVAERWQEDLSPETGLAVVRVVALRGDREALPLLRNCLEQETATIKRESLEAAVSLARWGDQELAEWAVAELEHDDAGVRTAAFKLLGVTCCKGMLRYAGQGLGDRDPQVRAQAAQVLATYGPQGLALAQDSLSSSNPDVVNSAMVAIGQVRTKRASNILYDYLNPQFQQVNRTRRWQGQIPRQEYHWQPLAIAIDNYHQTLIQQVLYVLSCLGYSSTVNTVTLALNTPNPREFANAVEVLASLPHRRFVLPLLPVLEAQGPGIAPPAPIKSSPQWLRNRGYKVLLEALEARDRWIRIGALMALTLVPAVLTKDPDPLVRDLAQQFLIPLGQKSLADARSPSDSNPMNQLLWLKDIALFKNLSLDELLLINKTLEQEQVSAGATIFQEGDWGTHLYLVAAGTVQLIKTRGDQVRELKRLQVGGYFGEVALFDDAPHWEGAIALEDCTLLKLEKSRFISLVTQRPHILLEICRFLSQRLRDSDRVSPSTTEAVGSIVL